MAFIWLLALASLAIFRDVVANGRPLYCRIEGNHYFPGLQTIWAGAQRPFGEPVLDSLRLGDHWRTYPYERRIFALIPFTPGEWQSDPKMFRTPPGAVHTGCSSRFRHWLGTDGQGRDVAAGLVAGARIALLTGLLASGLSLVLGVLLGALSGFWGDRRRISLAGITGMLVFLLLTIFYTAAWRHSFGVSGWQHLFWMAGFAGVAFMFGSIMRLARPFNRKLPLPLDMLVMRTGEVLDSVPAIVLIAALAAMLPGQSIWLLISLIGLLNWTGIAQLLRAELLRVREQPYIDAAVSAGLTPWNILRRHALPNAWQPVLVVAVFNVAGAILLEAALSFLGYGGLAFKGVSWGNILSAARQYPEDWWNTLFPGILITLTVWSLLIFVEEYD